MVAGCSQEFEEALLHDRDEGGINSTDADIVISMIRAEEEREENDDDTSSKYYFIISYV